LSHTPSKGLMAYWLNWHAYGVSQMSNVCLSACLSVSQFLYACLTVPVSMIIHQCLALRCWSCCCTVLCSHFAFSFLSKLSSVPKWIDCFMIENCFVVLSSCLQVSLLVLYFVTHKNTAVKSTSWTIEKTINNYNIGVLSQPTLADIDTLTHSNHRKGWYRRLTSLFFVPLHGSKSRVKVTNQYFIMLTSLHNHT
jgi:hypothetical protein